MKKYGLAFALALLPVAWVGCVNNNVDLKSSSSSVAIGMSSVVNSSSSSSVVVGLSSATSSSSLIVAMSVVGNTQNCIYSPTNTPSTVRGTLSCAEKNYKTVVIGAQIWMAENLNYIPAIGYTWCRDFDAESCKTYGRLYDWATAMALPLSCDSSDCSLGIKAQHQGICPAGWHIPSDAEWKTLEMYAGLTQMEADSTGYRGTVGAKLKSTLGWLRTHDYRTPGDGTDDFGFSALPGGTLGYDGMFWFRGTHTTFWSASQSSKKYTWVRSLNGAVEGVSRGEGFRSYGFSIRCLKDN